MLTSRLSIQSHEHPPPPPQKQRPVHFRAAFLHLPWQPFLQPQHISSEHALDASGRFVQFGSYKSASDLSHPQVSSEGIDGYAISAPICAQEQHD